MNTLRITIAALAMLATPAVAQNLSVQPVNLEAFCLTLGSAGQQMVEWRQGGANIQQVNVAIMEGFMDQQFAWPFMQTQAQFVFDSPADTFPGDMGAVVYIRCKHEFGAMQ